MKKTFKVVFLKTPAIRTMKAEPAKLCEQTIITDKSEVEICTPEGYVLMSIMEYLPEINLCKEPKMKVLND